MRLLAILVPVLALCACISAPPAAPRIERLSEGAAGPISSSAAPALEDIARMVREGTPSGVIIQKLRDVRVSYAVSAEQVGRLAAQGVPADVIDYLRYGDAARYLVASPGLYGYPAGYLHSDPYYDYYDGWGHRGLGPYPWGVYPYWGYGYGYRPWPYGSGYPRSNVYFGFGSRW